MEHVAITNAVLELSNGKDTAITDVRERLQRLAAMVKNHGLIGDDLLSLLQLITVKFLSVSEKAFMIRSCLIIRNSVSDQVIYRVLSFIKIKGKPLARPALQLLLLDWLLSNIDLINNSYATLHSCLPILFGLLPIEYCRPQISNLLLLARSKTVKTLYNKRIINPIKPKKWCIDILLNLIEKFPLDENLKILSNHFNGNELNISRNITTSSKRRRLLDPIDKVASIQELIENFHTLGPVTMNTVFQSKFRLYYVLLQIFSGNEEYLRKLDYMIEFYIDQNQNIDQIITISNSISFPLIENLIFKNSYNDNFDELFNNLSQKLKLLPSLKPTSFTKYDETFFKPTLQLITRKVSKRYTDKVHELIKLFISKQLELFEKWYKNEPTENDFVIFNTSITEFYKLVELNDFPGKHYLVIKIMDFIKLISINEFNKYFDDQAVLIPLTLLATMVFTNDPFVFSNLCGFMAHCKNYTFKDLELKAEYQNHIRDIINFIWLDNAFNNENRDPFQISSKLIDGLSQLVNSSILPLNTTGSIFQNPAWSHITAQIVWELEKEAGVSRHEGPVNAQSIANMNAENEMWLNMSYEEVKLVVLKKLDSLGFTGLADLLFTSVKSLANKRDVQQNL